MFFVITIVQLHPGTLSRRTSISVASLTSDGVTDKQNRSAHDVVMDGIITSSETIFHDRYYTISTYRGQTPPFAPWRLESIFSNFFKTLQKCSLSPDARITVGVKDKELASDQIIAEESITMVDYWKGFGDGSTRFISGLNGCLENVLAAFVCHVVLKLALQTEDIAESKIYYYVVGQLSREDDDPESTTQYAQFFLVKEDALQALGQDGFKLAMGEDDHQLLDWHCAAPEAENVKLAMPEPKLETVTKEVNEINVTNPTKAVAPTTQESVPSQQEGTF
jgi:hypothetical protein